MNDEYSAFVKERFKTKDFQVSPKMGAMLHAAVGISGEAGELLDAVKKSWAYGKPLDVANVLEELGDLMFYMQSMMNEFEWSWEDVMAMNVTKLRKRYPTGYTNEAAIARADKNDDFPDDYEV